MGKSAQDEQTIILADNKFDKTRENPDTNPYVAFVVPDPDTKKSYQIKGTVECHTSGEIRVISLIKEQSLFTIYTEKFIFLDFSCSGYTLKKIIIYGGSYV